MLALLAGGQGWLCSWKQTLDFDFLAKFGDRKDYIDLIFWKEVKTKNFPSTEFLREVCPWGLIILSASNSIIKDFALHSFTKNAEHFSLFLTLGWEDEPAVIVVRLLLPVNSDLAVLMLWPHFLLKHCSKLKVRINFH